MNTVDRLPRNVIKSAVTDLLPKGAPTIARTASLLGVSVRTLQRRLSKNGTSYTMLVDEVRCDTACRLLRAPHACVADVAAALGYADPSSFSRAFIRWTKISPREFRRLRAGQDHAGML